MCLFVDFFSFLFMSVVFVGGFFSYVYECETIKTTTTTKNIYDDSNGWTFFIFKISLMKSESF